MLDRTGVPATKQVRYWAAEVVGGKGRLLNEIDEVAWLDVLTAHDKLDYARDRDQLRAVVRADAAGRLTTWPLAVIRHAKARPRGSWTPPDPERPLDERGQAQAEAIVPLLAAYGVTRLVSSSSVRCADTLRPYAAAAGLPLRLGTVSPRRGLRPTRPAAPTTCAGSSNAVRRRPCAAMARCCRASSSRSRAWSTTAPTTVPTRRGSSARPLRTGWTRAVAALPRRRHRGGGPVTVERYPI